MTSFARIFERNGKQVVVTREPWGDNNAPSIVLAFEVSYGVARLAVEFKDSKLGEATRDKSFASMTEQNVFAMVDRTTQQFDPPEDDES